MNGQAGNEMFFQNRDKGNLETKDTLKNARQDKRQNNRFNRSDGTRKTINAPMMGTTRKKTEHAQKKAVTQEKGGGREGQRKGWVFTQDTEKREGKDREKKEVDGRYRKT